METTMIDLEEITEFTAKAPADLIDLDERLNAPGLRLSQWAFRGQPRVFGNLVPSFHREFGERQSAKTAELMERNLIDAFRLHYSTLQERTPAMPLPPAIDTNFDLRCLTVMQHYGVPTRLLDWASSFWTGVYFSCTGDPTEDSELWFYDRNLFQYQESWLTGSGALRTPVPPATFVPPEPPVLSHRGPALIFELDPQLTPRMKTQKAHHTVSSELFTDHAALIFDLWQGRVPPNDPEPGLRRIIIHQSCKEKALRFLADQEDITASTIFPDVEGLGRFLRWQLDSLKTTLL